MAKGCDRSPSIGRMGGVGNGDFLNTGIQQDPQAQAQVEFGLVGNPNHDFARGIRVEGVWFDQASSLQPLWVINIGGKEHIKRSAVLQLGEKVAGRTENELHLLTGSFLEAFAYIMKGELKVGSGDNGDVLCNAKPATKPRHENDCQNQPLKIHVFNAPPQTELLSLSGKLV